MEMQRGGSGLSRVLSDAVTALETRRCCASPSFHLLRQGSLRLSPPLARISPTRLTYTRPRMNAPRRPTGFHRAPNKHASTTTATTTTTVHGSSFREPPRSCFFFLFFCVASPSVPPPLLAFSKRRSNRLPSQRAIYEAGHAEFLNYSQVPVKFVGGSRPFVRPTRGEPFFIILRRVHRNAPRFVTVEE